MLKKLRAIENSNWFCKEAGSIRGLPDLIGHVKGKFCALEVKKNKKESECLKGRTVLQRRFIKEWGVHGFCAFVFPENEEEILDLLRRLYESGITR